MTDQEHKIRERAYALWEQEGRPQGRDREHWSQAQQELESEASQPASSEAGSADAAGPDDGSASATAEPKMRGTTG